MLVPGTGGSGTRAGPAGAGWAGGLSPAVKLLVGKLVRWGVLYTQQ
ncbi:hypothetical protein SLNWT_7101 [Streptomyces albus]|uniref:Uncharacterized protein n=1 Tax=Streptomyces albus (strain ATCC 21838 / DSM 41398 / FERM P-419 / JCM 4703 / NBRC 107858) TaxID=1081613 RepID=A0A0B5FAI9_STRA4|nr:hypothetical protein SLNWT_7101 [Streptomyces albus]AOU81781.1 hypothetical protein SLNHY_7090 [Streptomyces albus]